MTAIGPGDWVECVRNEGRVGTIGLFVLGGLYRVDRIGVHHGPRRVETWVTIIGHPMPPEGFPGWPVEAFRPISGGQKGMFDHLKKGVDAKIKELT